ncbi:MAG: hypothetical protein J07HB67_00380 [halophilic archaeon J07HB67]|nr:MAG: hypothetical protein J07HB67_00380 [halophilic archaeon J07HB67]
MYDCRGFLRSGSGVCSGPEWSVATLLLVETQPQTMTGRLGRQWCRVSTTDGVTET